MPSRHALIAVVIAALAALGASVANAQGSAPSTATAPADLIVHNARIYTVDEGRPVAEAMAVRGGRVAFVGSERGALVLRGPQTQVLDAAGATIIPGIADAHAHLISLGFTLSEVDLVGTTSYDQVVARVTARARTVPPGTWMEPYG